MAIRCNQSSIEKDREGGDVHHLPVDGFLRLQLHHELVGRAILKVGYRSGHPVELDTHLMKDQSRFISFNQMQSVGYVELMRTFALRSVQSDV